MKGGASGSSGAGEIMAAFRRMSRLQQQKPAQDRSAFEAREFAVRAHRMSRTASLLFVNASVIAPNLVMEVVSDGEGS